MMLRGTTLSELLRPQSLPVDETLPMDHDSFQVLYERTARPLWTYLWRRTGDPHLADDLLQETYYRFLRARGTHDSEEHRKNYLFRVAANLVNDVHRSQTPAVPIPSESEGGHPVSGTNFEIGSQRRTDLDRAMAHLSGRQRDALWLAYAEGSTHAEIADRLGLKLASVKLFLFRARRKLARLLEREGKA